MKLHPTRLPLLAAFIAAAALARAAEDLLRVEVARLVGEVDGVHGFVW